MKCFVFAVTLCATVMVAASVKPVKVDVGHPVTPGSDAPLEVTCPRCGAEGHSWRTCPW
ncbi:hypothetical protein PGT21_029366 [Puccinia graminis f. sp. tritici]|nr:hypothetical protein PGT21_029366 [Puccinia graminis f. sp. tritici]KAA1128304.1 hypothetical protein PGTUg99_003580 [Puccinia graminis f. sp. tritici]